MICTRCDGTGFLNLHQLDADTLALFERSGDHQIILDWIASNGNYDVSVCDCCGDGEHWHGTPGEHHLEDGEPFPECY
jgi:hypothetical protein